MANVPESASYDAGIYQIETVDAVIGGMAGVSNAQAKGLANRTKWLKEQVEAVASGMAAHESAPDPHPLYLTEAANALFALKAALDSPAFAGVPTAPTPAQFDASTKIATTNFVKRALGNLSGAAVLAANTTLTAAHAGNEIVLSGAGGFSATLPLISDVPAGTAFYFTNVGSGASNVIRQGADVIDKGGSTISSVPVGIGDSLAMVSNGAYWNMVGGSAQLLYAAVFGASLAANGYQKLPSGLIVQWGSIASTGNPNTFTLPIAYPNAHFRAWGCFQDNSDARFATAAPATLSTATCVGRTDAGAVVTSGELIQIFSIGY